jgi:hypothetical protein
MNNLPKAGQFYYHFKHQDSEGLMHYLFQIIGTAIHSEDKKVFVVYKSFDPNSYAAKNGLDYIVRPIEMFIENVEKPEINYFGPRFRLVEDVEVVRRLEKGLN